ncbi:MAG: carboxypeptidase-like regulatory domain-containing protein [Cyclobacteriaceae bacterium]|nr:carboxypeptidase-like regulatory domain-containing protein [Cyclobacteriaceae bacterium]
MTRLTTITIFILTSITLFGQDTIEIAGEVISKYGTPLPGTNIVLHKTTNGTVTNACGQFKLRIPKDKKGYLSFSMISLPFYFDLGKIKDEDLDKGIVFKIIPFNEDKGILDKDYWKENITIECEKFEYKVVFKITEKNSDWPID